MLKSPTISITTSYALKNYRATYSNIVSSFTDVRVEKSKVLYTKYC